MVEFEIEHGVSMRLFNLMNLFSGGELPYNDGLIAAAGDDDVFLGLRIKLQAKDGLDMSHQRGMPQSFGIQVPDSHSFVSASTN